MGFLDNISSFFKNLTQEKSPEPIQLTQKERDNLRYNSHMNYPHLLALAQVGVVHPEESNPNKTQSEREVYIDARIERDNLNKEHEHELERLNHEKNEPSR